LPPWRTQT